MRISRVHAFAALATSSAALAAQAQIVPDGSFEASGPSGSPWIQTSTNFGTPLCDGSCFNPPTTTAARTGQWWAWFGGEPFAVERGTLTQTITVPAGPSPVLEFFLTCYTERSDGTDYLKVLVDGVPVYTIVDFDMGPFTLDYTLISVPMPTVAPGVHTLKFDSQTNGGGLLTNIWVDDVAISTPAITTCYPNCDNSSVPPLLNSLDFTCFLSRFAAQSTYANCDASTAAPVLNALDFACFLTRFAAGCS